MQYRPSAFRKEMKFFDNWYQWELQQDTWATTVVNYGVALGSSANQRIGSKINMKKVLIRMRMDFYDDTVGNTITWNNTEGNIAMCFRYVIVYDRQSNAGVPTFADVFAITPTGTSSVVIEPVSQFNNIDNKDRFTVLKDSRITLSQGMCPGGLISCIVPINKITKYQANSTTGQPSTMTTGCLVMFSTILKNNRANVGTNIAAITYNSRLRYYDN